MIDMRRTDSENKRQTLVEIFITLPILLIISMYSIHPASADQLKTNPVEVGSVSWSRDYNEALKSSRVTGKPLFLLFQEVPGCIGCKTFGQTVLTHPDLVKAIENEFIPVLVMNNRSTGMDAELLERFGEPAWNYQVIRFIDADENDIIARRDRVWDIEEIASRMIKTLDAVGRSVPRYLEALARGNYMKGAGTTHDD